MQVASSVHKGCGRDRSRFDIAPGLQSERSNMDKDSVHVSVTILVTVQGVIQFHCLTWLQ